MRCLAVRQGSLDLKGALQGCGHSNFFRLRNGWRRRGGSSRLGFTNSAAHIARWREHRVIFLHGIDIHSGDTRHPDSRTVGHPLSGPWIRARRLRDPLRVFIVLLLPSKIADAQRNLSPYEIGFGSLFAVILVERTKR